ncbi:hypothetical protein RFI_04054 [Reticulomyxa filosa]|uniref:Uncharacterized protein n=1 Tax=Reticulomyxa filosa TaxID=46433 RepID=X6P610_RETFI|nr:hypothetical protein RFI_04054 [Reticulomyxa filosa]|eukprot:ETO33052.1 hypothetical protein RFI_04054 [Reticulomyxa filosa]
MDWEKWKDTEMSMLANHYVQYSRDSENTNKLRWLKVRIILQVIKHVINECISQKCQVPSEFIEHMIVSLVEIDSMLSSTTTAENILQATKALRELIKCFHEKSKEDKDWETLQSELRQIEVIPLSSEPDPSSNLYYIVSQQNTKRLRIYLYCPNCTKYKQTRTRSIFFPNTPEGYSKFPPILYTYVHVHVCSFNKKMECLKTSHTKKKIIRKPLSIAISKTRHLLAILGRFPSVCEQQFILQGLFSQKKMTEADIPHSAKAFIIEEKSYYCQDLKSLQLELTSIRAIFDAVAPHLSHLDSVTMQQVCKKKM